MQDKASGSQQQSVKRRKTKGGEDDEVCFAFPEGRHAHTMGQACIICMLVRL